MFDEYMIFDTFIMKILNKSIGCKFFMKISLSWQCVFSVLAICFSINIFVSDLKRENKIHDTHVDPISFSTRSADQRTFIPTLGKILVVNKILHSIYATQGKYKSIYVGEVYWSDNIYVINDFKEECFDVIDVKDYEGNSSLDEIGIVVIRRRYINHKEKDIRYLSFLEINKLKSLHDIDSRSFSVIASFPEIK